LFLSIQQLALFFFVFNVYILVTYGMVDWQCGRLKLTARQLFVSSC